MARKILSIVVTASLILASPGGSAWVLLAEDGAGDSLPVLSGRAIAPTSDEDLPVLEGEPVTGLIDQIERNPAILNRVLPEQRAQIIEFLNRNRTALSSGNAPPEVIQKLRSTYAALGQKDADPTLALDGLYDLSDFTRSRDSMNTIKDVLYSKGGKTVVAIRSGTLGRTLMTQTSQEIGYQQTRITVRRVDPLTGKKLIDEIVIEEKKGSAVAQHVVYSRQIEMLFRNLKKSYYDQEDLAEKIQGAPGLAEKICSESTPPASAPEMPAKARAALIKEFCENKSNFPTAILGYLAELDGMTDADGRKNFNELKQMDWRQFESVRNAAMTFYSDKQITALQKGTISALINYFAQVTGTQPPQEKNELSELDSNLKSGTQGLDDLQKVLTAYNQGEYGSAGVGGLLVKGVGGRWSVLGVGGGIGGRVAKALGFSDSAIKLSEEAEKKGDISPEIMALASEAVADIAYAKRAQARALQEANATGHTAKSASEAIAADLAESQGWLSLAKMRLESFYLNLVAMQTEHMAKGQMPNHMGIDRSEADKPNGGLIGQALRLSKIAREQYAGELENAARDSKRRLLAQDIGQFEQALQNARYAYLYLDDLRARVRKMAALVEEMRDLYLSRKFDEVKNTPDYQGKENAAGRLQGHVYQYYLDHLPYQVSRAAGLLQTLQGVLATVSTYNSVRDIQKALSSDVDFSALHRLLGFEESPDMTVEAREAKNASIKQSHLFAAAQNQLSLMQLFDSANLREIYLKKEASSSNVVSAQEGEWYSPRRFFSFKWLNDAYGYFPKRDKGIQKGIKNLENVVCGNTGWCDEKAFALLGDANPYKDKVLDAFRRGDFYYGSVVKDEKGQVKEVREGALPLLDQWDREGSIKAVAEYRKKKPASDPFQDLDFESFMSHDPTSEVLIRAQGADSDIQKHLPSYIKQYSVVSGLTDGVITAGVTAGIGLIGDFGKALLTPMQVAAEMEKAQLMAGELQSMSKFGRIMDGLNTIGHVPVLRILPEYGAAVLHDYGSMAGSVKFLPGKFPNPFKWNVVRQVVTNSFWNAGKSIVLQTGMMSFASGGMSAVERIINPNTSSFKTVGEAFREGAVGGLAFGARAALIMPLNPMKTVLFGRGWLGSTVRAAAQMAGPISGTIDAIANLVAKDSELAEIGTFGKLQRWLVEPKGAAAGNLAEAAGSGRFGAIADGWKGLTNFAGRSAVFSAGFVDGSLKFWGVMAVPSVATALVAYKAYPRISSAQKYWASSEISRNHPVASSVMSWILGKPGEIAAGSTERLMQLTGAMSPAMTVAQGSWLAVPMHPGYSPEELASHQESQAAVEEFWRTGRAEVVERSVDGVETRRTVTPEDVDTLPIGTDLEISRPWYRTSFSDMLRGRRTRLAGKWDSILPSFGFEGGSPKLKIKVSEPLRETFAQRRLEREVANGSYADLLRRSLYEDKDREEAGGSIEDLPLFKPQGETLPELKGTEAGRITEQLSQKPGFVQKGPPSEKLVSIQSKASAETLLNRVLKDNPKMREAILNTGDVYVYQDPVTKATTEYAGTKLDRLRGMADAIQNESSLTLADRFKLTFMRAGDFLAGRRLSSRLDLIIDQIEKKASANIAEKMKEPSLPGFEEYAETAGAPKAKSILEATREAVTDYIGKTGSKVDKLALNQIRSSVEGAVNTRYVSRMLEKDIRAGKDSKQSAKEHARLLVDVWEQGVMGKDFKDAHGRAIDSFRDPQKQAILQTLEAMADGHTRIYNLLSTGGGKTLLSFVFLDFLQTYSRARGKSGLYYVTTNGTLVSQAREAYKAFFKGREPPFEIITFSELMSKQAEAATRGSQSPFLTHDMVWDEADEPGTTVPLALGQFRGQFSNPALDPAYAVLQKAAKELAVKANHEKTDLNEATMGELKDYPQLAKELDAKTEQITAALKRAIDYAQSSKFLKDMHEQYDAQYGKAKVEQLVADIRKEHENAFGGLLGIKMGVITRQHDQLKNWVGKLMRGTYMLKTQKDLSTIFRVVDGKSQQMNNGTPYDSLDTPYRAAVELINGNPLTLDFDTVNITNIRSLMKAAKEHGTLIIGLSGTIPDGMIRPMVKEFGWKIVGTATVNPASVEHIVLPPGMTVIRSLGDVAQAINDHNLKEGVGAKDVMVIWVKSPSERAAIEAELDRRGITKERRSVGVYSGKHFDLEKLGKYNEIKALENKEAFEAGNVDVMILEGRDGLRGYDPDFSPYAGGKIHFYTTSPEELAKVSQTQLWGRLAGSRAGGAEVIYNLISEWDSLVRNETYRGAATETLRGVESGRDAGLWHQIEAMVRDAVKEKVAENPVEEASTGKNLLTTVPNQKTEKTWRELEAGLGSRQGVVEALRRLERDPMMFELRGKNADYKAIIALRERMAQLGIKPEEVLAQKEELNRLLQDPEIFEILIPEMQRIAELNALGSSGLVSSHKPAAAVQKQRK